MKRSWMILGIALTAAIVALPATASAEESMVYSIYKGLDFGNPGETPQKDFYVNIGTKQGIKPGSVLEVIRKIATYDLTSQKLYKDVVFPIAKIKVIHAEANAAIARLESMLPADQTPVIVPRAVMVGDTVRSAL